MLEIAQADIEKQRDVIQKLFWEFLETANAVVEREQGIRLAIQAMLDQSMAHLEEYAPPRGRLLLPREDGQILGFIALREIAGDAGDAGDVPRLYVRPEYRGRGIGRSLAEALIEEARQIGY